MRVSPADELCAAAPTVMVMDALTAVAGLVWSGDLPRAPQQVLFDTADGIVF